MFFFFSNLDPDRRWINQSVCLMHRSAQHPTLQMSKETICLQKHLSSLTGMIRCMILFDLYYSILFLKHPLQTLKIALEFVSDRVFPQKKITYLDKISSRHSPSLKNPGSMNMQILLMSKVKQLQARSLLLHQKVRP